MGNLGRRRIDRSGSGGQPQARAGELYPKARSMGDAKSESRNPKTERNPKPRNPKGPPAESATRTDVAFCSKCPSWRRSGSNACGCGSVFGFRISAFLRFSDFGFRVSRHPASKASHKDKSGLAHPPTWRKPRQSRLGLFSFQFNLHLTVFAQAQPADDLRLTRRQPARLFSSLKLRGGRSAIHQLEVAQAITRHQAGIKPADSDGQP